MWCQLDQHLKCHTAETSTLLLYSDPLDNLCTALLLCLGLKHQNMFLEIPCMLGPRKQPPHFVQQPRPVPKPLYSDISSCTASAGQSDSGTHYQHELSPKSNGTTLQKTRTRDTQVHVVLVML
jgi:hypothetical protein